METEIIASRGKTACMLLGSLAFVAMGLFVPDREGNYLIWGAVFFAACSTVLVVLLIRPQRLSLDQEGLTLSGGLLRSPTRIAWRDVSGFFVVPIRPGGSSLIGFNYSPGAANKPKGAAFSRRLAGADGALSGVWSGSNTAVVDKLNAYREYALTLK